MDLELIVFCEMLFPVSNYRPSRPVIRSSHNTDQHVDVVTHEHSAAITPLLHEYLALMGRTTPVFEICFHLISFTRLHLTQLWCYCTDKICPQTDRQTDRQTYKHLEKCTKSLLSQFHQKKKSVSRTMFCHDDTHTHIDGQPENINSRNCCGW